MKNVLLSACAAALIAATASAASAGQFTMTDDGPSGAIIGVDDSHDYGNDWRYRSRDYGYDDDEDYGYGNGYGSGEGYGQGYGQGYGYGNGYGRDYGYGNDYGYQSGYGYPVLPPRAIVRSLYRSGFSHISHPALAGRFYQVKARDPYGRKVKLYINAFNGRIVKVKH